MQHWTEETDREAITFFDSLSVAEIRKRQHLCNLQIDMAYEQHNDDALADLRRMEDSLMASMMRRV